MALVYHSTLLVALRPLCTVIIQISDGFGWMVYWDYLLWALEADTMKKRGHNKFPASHIRVGKVGGLGPHGIKEGHGPRRNGGKASAEAVAMTNGVIIQVWAAIKVWEPDKNVWVARSTGTKFSWADMEADALRSSLTKNHARNARQV